MQFHPQEIAKPLDREFGRVIPAAKGFAEFSANRRYIDDPPDDMRQLIDELLQLSFGPS
jgi:hypothetical protein